MSKAGKFPGPRARVRDAGCRTPSDDQLELAALGEARGVSPAQRCALCLSRYDAAAAAADAATSKLSRMLGRD